MSRLARKDQFISKLPPPGAAQYPNNELWNSQSSHDPRRGVQSRISVECLMQRSSALSTFQVRVALYLYDGLPVRRR